MFQICLFGGYEGVLRPNKRIFLTMFGACELRRPTLARLLLSQRAQAGSAAGREPRRRQVVITVCGATEIKSPTLAEEFIDLQEAIRSGALSTRDWDAFIADLDAAENDTVFSFTLMAGFGETELPGEDEEVDALALQRHLGNLSDDALRTLQLGVGQSGGNRRAVLKQAIAAHVG